MTEHTSNAVSAFDSLTLSPARWRRLALSGAAVGSAAASSAAMAGVVQITQAGNEVTSLANNLRADLTGDGVTDLPGLGVDNGETTFTSSGNWFFRNRAAAHFDSPGGFYYQALGRASYFRSGAGVVAFSNTTAKGYRNTVGGFDYRPSMDSSGMVPITFTDALVNGGATTNALVEVRAFSTSKTSHAVRLVRLFFNARSTAAPTGAGTVVGSTAPEFSRAAAAAQAAAAQAAAARLASISILNQKIAQLTKQLRKANKKKKKAIAKKLKRAKAQLAAL